MNSGTGTGPSTSTLASGLTSTLTSTLTSGLTSTLTSTSNTGETFQKKAIDVENTKLTYYTEKAKEDAVQTQEENLFINLSISEILKNISRTFIDIMNDITKEGPRDLIRIIGRGDRMIYVGIIILFISFSIYLVDITAA